MLILPAAAPEAQEYELFGSIDFSGTYTCGEDEDAAGGGLILEGHHRLYLDKAEGVPFHSLEIPYPGEDYSHIIYEAYILWYPSDWINLSLGRQKIEWGTGFFFTPSDSLHPSGEPFEDPRGFPGIVLSLSPRSSMNLDLCLSLENLLDEGTNNAYYGKERLKDLKYAINFSFLVNLVDTSFTIVFDPEDTLRPGLSLSVDLLGIYGSLKEPWNCSTMPPTSGKAVLQNISRRITIPSRQ